MPGAETSFFYEVDRTYEGYFNNWMVTTDLMCASQLHSSLVGSSYFIGIIFGIFMFQMPNNLGRKKTMEIVMPIYILCSAITVFAPYSLLKAVGFFTQGLLHIKIPLSYIHVYELVPEEKKGLCTILINICDNFTLAFFSLIALFVTKDADDTLKALFFI